MIKISNVFKTYRNDKLEVPALRGVTVDIKAGEFLAIAGPSGSGKTTLLNAIGCIDSIDKGEIIVNDFKIHGKNEKELVEYRRKYLGFIFQSYNLIPVLSAYENVALALSLLTNNKQELKSRSMKALEEVGLKGVEHQLPTQLSGGQQQRVAVARALVKNPLIVLADEPTANLDSKNAELIIEIMKEMNKKYGTTFIFSTHDERVIKHASRVIHIQDGQIYLDESKK